MARAFVLALFACVVLLCVSSPGVGAERVLADINATYISQVFDTQVVNAEGEVFNGHAACGPTSCIMAIASFNKLPEIPITVQKPMEHKSSFGYYVASEYSAYGFTYNQTDHDPSGVEWPGAYGSCTTGGAGLNTMIRDFLSQHDLDVVYHDFNTDGVKLTFDMIKKAIDRGATVVLDTKLTSSGHILFVYGYDTGDDGTHTDIILNDPYGNAYDRNTYGTLLNGQEVTYTWDMVYATDRWMVEVSV